MYPKAYWLLIFLGLFFSIVFANPTTSHAQSNTSTIRVCKVLADPDGNIVTGAEQPGAVFRQRWFAPNPSLLAPGFNPASTVPKDAVFTTPLTLNTLLPNIPAGPNGLNAQCITDYPAISWNLNSGGRRFAQIYYDRVATPNGFWQPIKYHDGWIGSQTLSTIDVYYDNLFDGNNNNNEESQRNGNADGHVCLGQCGSTTNLVRTLMIYTRYSRHLTPRPSATPTRTPTPKPTVTPPPSNRPKNSIRVCQVIANPDGSVTTGAEQPGQQFRFQWFSPSRSMLSSQHELASTVPSDAVFTTPLTLNALLPNIPAGPGGLNAQCKDDYGQITLNYGDDDDAYANLFYRQLPDPTGSWQPIRYHDGFSGSQTLTTFSEYTGVLFDGNNNNDDSSDRNLNADGHVQLKEGAKRTILIYSRYSKFFTPSPTPSGPTCQTSTGCSDFAAGRRTSFDTITAPTASNPITINDDNVWIKITINALNNQLQTIRLNELINTSNFTLDNPSTNITVKQSGSNITNNCKAGTNGCSITTATNSNVVINLPAISSPNKFEIFLKILPQREGTNLQVNNSSSRIRYQNGTEVALDNATLTVSATLPPVTAYFTTQNSGNIYSGGTIKNPLPSGTSLFETIAGVLFHRPTSAIQLGSGTIANSPQPTYHISGYTHSNNSITKLVGDIQTAATTASQPYNHPSMTNGVYRYTSSQEFNFNYDAVSRGGEQQFIILIEGDLTIGGEITLPKTGREGIMFVVTGNIYVKPSVEKLHGIFVSQGKFYTGCNGAPCSSTDQDSLRNNLTLEGAVIAMDGVSLNRLGTASNQKAETFIYRPDLILFASATAGYSDYLWQEIEPK